MSDQAGTARGPLRRDPDVVWREYNRGILTESGLALNTTAAFVFKACDGTQTADGIVDTYQARFNVSRETAEDDVATVLDQLVTQNMVTRE